MELSRGDPPRSAGAMRKAEYILEKHKVGEPPERTILEAHGVAEEAQAGKRRTPAQCPCVFSFHRCRSVISSRQGGRAAALTADELQQHWLWHEAEPGSYTAGPKQTLGLQQRRGRQWR